MGVVCLVYIQYKVDQTPRCLMPLESLRDGTGIICFFPFLVLEFHGVGNIASLQVLRLIGKIIALSIAFNCDFIWYQAVWEVIYCAKERSTNLDYFVPRQVGLFTSVPFLYILAVYMQRTCVSQIELHQNPYQVNCLPEDLVQHI